ARLVQSAPYQNQARLRYSFWPSRQLLRGVRDVLNPVHDNRTRPPTYAHEPFEAQQLGTAKGRKHVERLLHHWPLDRLLARDGERDVGIGMVTIVLPPSSGHVLRRDIRINCAG